MPEHTDGEILFCTKAKGMKIPWESPSERSILDEEEKEIDRESQ